MCLVKKIVETELSLISRVLKRREGSLSSEIDDEEVLQILKKHEEVVPCNRENTFKMPS